MNLAGKAPGPVTVKMTTQTGVCLGKTLFTYEDRRKKPGELTLSIKRRHEQFEKLSLIVDEMHRPFKQLKKEENETLDSQLQGESNHMQIEFHCSLLFRQSALLWIQPQIAL